MNQHPSTHRVVRGRLIRIAVVPVRLILTCIWVTILIVTSLVSGVGTLAYICAERLKHPLGQEVDDARAEPIHLVTATESSAALALA